MKLLHDCAALIRKERKRQKMTPSKFLAKANFVVHESSLKKLSQFESGKLDVTFDLLHTFARVLNKNIMIKVSSKLSKPVLYLQSSKIDNRE